jgi:hypothetical protein
MSVRAYRVIEIKTAHPESFNLWHDDEVLGWLEAHTDFLDKLDRGGNGLTSILVEDLERMLTEIGDSLDKDTKERIEGDIKFAKGRGDLDIQYYCY